MYVWVLAVYMFDCMGECLYVWVMHVWVLGWLCISVYWILCVGLSMWTWFWIHDCGFMNVCMYVCVGIRGLYVWLHGWMFVCMDMWVIHVLVSGWLYVCVLDFMCGFVYVWTWLCIDDCGFMNEWVMDWMISVYKSVSMTCLNACLWKYIYVWVIEWLSIWYKCVDYDCLRI